MQPMRLMVLSMLAAMLVALPAAQGEEAAGDGNPPAQLLPPDTELEAAGARIGSITIESRQIFDVDDPRENYGIYRLANRLHMRTRESTVRAQLLFREGQPYRRQALEESERNLRQLDFLREPRVRPVRYRDGLVDVEVGTHDVWTLQLGPSYGRSGGAGESSFEIQDNNLFGFGKTLAIGVGKDVDRTSTYFSWRDPNVASSRWRDSIHWKESSDGHARSFGLWHPFYSLTTRWAGGLSVGQNHWSNSRYLLGDKYDDYDSRARSTDLYVGWSPGLKGAFTRRYTLGVRQDESRFAPNASGATLGPVPADRLLRYPYLRFDLITDSFRKTTNHDQIARTEDQQFGLNATLIGGWADRGFGADRNALIVDSTISYGFALGADHDLFASLAAAGRLEGGAATDARLRAEAGWYWGTSPHTLLHVRAVFDTGHRLDLDHYFELGGENGLRGYPLRYQQGTRRTIAKIEERVYTEWSLWRLLDVGGAVFFDIGRTTGANPIGAPQLGWLKDAGVGLRLGNSHSSLGNVIHIDLAMPIGAPTDISGLQLLVGTQATF
jgi:outer membrane translocation and assembly module TamA